jgi:hypothetical protein
MYPFATAVGPRRDPGPYFLRRMTSCRLWHKEDEAAASLTAAAAEGSTSMSINNTAAQAALLFAITLVSGADFAQGAAPAKRPTIGSKPILQVKPTAPMDCKLVGRLRHPRCSPTYSLFPRGRNRSTRNKAAMRNADRSQSG